MRHSASMRFKPYIMAFTKMNDISDTTYLNASWWLKMIVFYSNVIDPYHGYIVLCGPRDTVVTVSMLDDDTLSDI